jgi:hypothetical protein
MIDLTTVQAAIYVVNSLIVLSGNADRFRQLVAKAVSENRDISNDEIEELKVAALSSINRARNID